jgi:hypothetical protein
MVHRVLHGGPNRWSCTSVFHDVESHFEIDEICTLFFIQLAYLMLIPPDFPYRRRARLVGGDMSAMRGIATNNKVAPAPGRISNERIRAAF